MTHEAMRYETVLLDFHGTFTSNIGRTAHALNAAYQSAYGRNVTREEFIALINRNDGRGEEEFISLQQHLEHTTNGSLTPEEKREFIETFRRHNEGIYIPKHRHLIQKLYELGAVCVIVTNGNEDVVRRTIATWSLNPYIVEIYGKGPGGLLENRPRKPDAGVIDFVIGDLRKRGLQVRRDRTLMLGDYQDDIGAGNNAGIHTAFIVTGPNQRPEYYSTRPTYALLDTPLLEPESPWLHREDTYQIRDLPQIVTGDL